MGDLWNSVVDWGGAQYDKASAWANNTPADEGPITVPVTAADEEQASWMNTQADRAAQDRCYEQQAGWYDYDPSQPYENYCD
jgi:hypothetical protein